MTAIWYVAFGSSLAGYVSGCLVMYFAGVDYVGRRLDENIERSR